MIKRKRGPKPTPLGERKRRIVVKLHEGEMGEVLQAFADHKEHPATWLRNKALEYARFKNLKP